MNLNLKDKVILVTGGDKGIGFGICQRLAKEGAIPFIVGRTKKDVKKAVSHIQKEGGKCSFSLAELTRPEECRAAVAKAVMEYGRIDGLVNNAGVNDGVGLEHGNYEDFMKSLDKNLTHYYLMFEYSLPHLIKNSGNVVNISSKTAITGQGGTSGYAAANGGRNALTESLAIQYFNKGIRVNAVIVSESFTPQYKRWIKQFPNADELLQSIENKIPLEKRMTTPDEIADTTTFLLSEKSKCITGQLFYVDGGYVHLDRAIY
ncbi:SDR family oxidoreductase [Flagellimonas sp.]|uniref:SDR family oxidoreductase n=1 Tax=Flagellimonas sp. TaxID=2058762 RepID=UPI003BB148EE